MLLFFKSVKMFTYITAACHVTQITFVTNVITKNDTSQFLNDLKCRYIF